MYNIIIIYDENGRIFSHYRTDNETNVPSGIPYIVLKDYDDDSTNENYRPILRVDVTKTPHEVVFGLTEEEAKEASITLDEYKDIKINESKELLASYLEEHPITSTAHNGIAGVYSVTEKKQQLMTSTYVTYQIESQVNPDAILAWNETGKPYEKWQPEEFLQLIIEVKNYVKPRVAIQQLYEESVMNAISKEDIDAIELCYDNVNQILLNNII